MTCGGNLLRNGVVVSTQVEDLQVRFGVDDNRNHVVDNGEFPIDDLMASVHDLAMIRTTRVLLTSRSVTPNANFAGRRTQAANRDAGAVDHYKRRRVTVDVALRNAR